MRQPILQISVLLVFLAVAMSFAQPDLRGKEVKGFVFPEYDEDGVLKWRLKGDAKFITENLVQMRNVKMESFEDGKTQLTFTTPTCRFDRVTKVATTDDEVKIVGELFTIHGKGMVWSSQDGRWVLREQVRVVVTDVEGLGQSLRERRLGQTKEEGQQP